MSDPVAINAPNGVNLGFITEQDLPFAMSLSAQAGWNQTEVDWRRMLSIAADGCLMARWEGRPAGTTVCCDFGQVAWLALVLVEQSLRGLGIGRSLVQTGLKHALEIGCQSVRLDATPLGIPVYERLGFQPQFELTRWSGVIGASSGSPQKYHICKEPAEPILKDLQALDRQATRTDRTKFLRELFTYCDPWIARNDDGKPVCYLVNRPGRLAVQLGPGCGELLAISELLHVAAACLQGQLVFIDIPNARKDLQEIARAFGLTPVRSLLRMGYGILINEESETYHVSSGPELG